MQNQIQNLNENLGQSKNQNQPPKKESLSLMTVKTLLVVLIVAAIGMIVVGRYIFKDYYEMPENNRIVEPADQKIENYYNLLEKKCAGDSCCLSSLKFMKENNYKEADENYKCPNGFKASGLKCESSLGWCDPIEEKEINNEIALCEEIIYEDSKNRCYIDYAMSRNDKNLCEKITDNVLKEECYNNLNKKNKIDIPVFWALGSDPDAIPIAKTYNVLFTTMQTGLEDKANKIVIEEIDASGNIIKILGDLNDKGINGDLAINDYVYSGTFKISSTKEGNLFFRAKADFLNISKPIYTDRYKFGVTRFPIGLYPSDMSKIVIDSKTGEKMMSNEVIVGFIGGVSPDTIENIIKAVDGEIVGTIFGLGTYQVKIFDTGDDTGVNKTINKLLNYSEVEFAEPSYMTEID